MNCDQQLLSLILRDAQHHQQLFKAAVNAAKQAVNQPIINFTRNLIVDLHKVTVEAGKAGKEAFTFEGREFFVGYAEYLLEHLSERFDLRGPLDQPLRYKASEMRAARTTKG